MENKDFNSKVDINFRRGAEGADTYFLPTGYTTCKYIFCSCLHERASTILLIFMSVRGTANLTSSGFSRPELICISIPSLDKMVLISNFNRSSSTSPTRFFW
uniref:Protein BRE n=1 Tax=Rhizophora mucronata TaxID=61149 RepID=A0A2P2LEP7_RHIMU